MFYMKSKRQLILRFLTVSVIFTLITIFTYPGLNRNLCGVVTVLLMWILDAYFPDWDG